MLSDDKKFGCVLDYGHKGECYVGARGVDCHTQQLEDEIARLRALVDAAEANAKLHFEAAEAMRAENDRLRADMDWHRSESERLSAAMPSGYALLVMHSAVARSSFDEGARDTAIDAINRLDAARKGVDRAYPPEEV